MLYVCAKGDVVQGAEENNNKIPLNMEFSECFLNSKF